MEKNSWRKLLIIGAFFSLLTSGCEDNQDTNYVFTGKVIDQVTGQPVSDATIRYAHRQFNEHDHPVTRMDQYALSGADGRFTLVVPKELIDDNQRYPGPVIYAEDSGYVGSNILDAPKGGGNINLELYHSSQLYLHVQNDTINNQIDETKIWITGDRDFWTYPGFIGTAVHGMYASPQFTCKGRDFDTVFIIKPLWGNLNYSLGGGVNYFPGPHDFSESVKLIPDIINYLSVSY